MPRGRKPKPTAAKKLAGNPGKRPLNENEPEPTALAELPAPPDFLLPDAVAEWERVGPELVTCGLLTVADVAHFAAYCQCWARYVEAERWIQENGICMTIRNDKGEVKFSQPVPRFSIAKAMLEKLRSFGSEFGLSPSARVGLDGAGNGGKPKSSALAEFAKKQAEANRAAAERRTAKPARKRTAKKRPTKKPTARKRAKK